MGGLLNIVLRWMRCCVNHMCDDAIWVVLNSVGCIRNLGAAVHAFVPVLCNWNRSMEEDRWYSTGNQEVGGMKKL